jgi:Flp pilus assembly protein TadG
MPLTCLMPGRPRGGAALEFALLAPVFTLLALGTFDLGHALQTSMRLERAARAGAQFALAQPRDLAGIQVATLAAWPDLGAGGVPAPIEQCRCGAQQAACALPCQDGQEWLVTVTAQRSITTLLLPGLGVRTGSATVRVR